MSRYCPKIARFWLFLGNHWLESLNFSLGCTFYTLRTVQKSFVFAKNFVHLGFLIRMVLSAVYKRVTTLFRGLELFQ